MKNRNYIPLTKERAAKVQNISVSEIYRVIDEHWR